MAAMCRVSVSCLTSTSWLAIFSTPDLDVCHDAHQCPVRLTRCVCSPPARRSRSRGHDRSPWRWGASAELAFVHALRHTTSSLLKQLGVPPRDRQAILGHAHVTTTEQIYTYVDDEAKRDALTKLNKLLGGSES
jgi:Phage integrase family